MKVMPVAYQLYSARAQAQKDLKEVLLAVRGMGYSAVEFAGFYGHSAGEITQLLKEAGLRAVSSHVPYFEIVADMQGVIAYHQAIGCRYIAVPYLDEAHRPGAAGFARALREMNRFGAMCREKGLTLLYHNHDFEFIRLSGQYGLDFLYDALAPEVMQTEIDVCWVKYAGEDPADYIRRYQGRCPVVHLKDYTGTKGEASPYALIGDAKSRREAGHRAFEFKPVGYGCQDIKAILEAAIASGAEWFVVEQDEAVGCTPLEAARMSIGTLKKLGLVVE